MDGIVYRRFPSLSENTVMWIAALALMAFSVCVILDRHFIGHTSPLFWDMPVYLRATDLLAAGENPYVSDLLHRAGVPDYLYFISPPAVMMLFAAIGNSPLHPLFAPTLTILHFLAMAGTPLLLGRLLFGQSPARIALAAGAFFTLFASAGLSAFSAMNNGSALYFLILMAAITGLTAKHWTAFHVFTTIASIFKPYYVFFWILPVLAHGFNGRQAFIGAGLSALAALTYILPLWLAPDIFWAWMGNVATTLDIDDVGGNIFGAATSWDLASEWRWLPHAAQGVYMCFLAGLLLLGRLRGRKLWAALLVGAVFMNPRPLGYDVATAAIPFAFLAATLLPRTLGSGWRLPLSTVGLAGLMMVLSYEDRIIPAAVLFPLMAAGVLTVLVLRAGKRSGGPGRRRSPETAEMPGWHCESAPVTENAETATRRCPSHAV